MAPQRTRKRKDTASTAMSDSLEPTTAPTLSPTKHSSPLRTPTQSPKKSRPMKISAAQKQALIDNLQLEITERARRLRAQYALQAQGLRTRLEIRVHRIPPALRKRTIEEVLKEYGERNALSRKGNNIVTTQIARASPVKVVEKMSKIAAAASPVPRIAKRPSTDMDTEAEKENTSVTNPKKRARTAPTPPPKTHAAPPARLVLSPRSNNSRTLPATPFKPLPPSPFKSQIARPISPLKPSVTVPTASSLAKTTAPKTTKSKAIGATRAASRQGAISAASGRSSQVTRPKRGAVAADPPVAVMAEGQDDGRASSMSDASAGTTIIDKATTTLQKAPAAKKQPRIMQGRYTGPGAAPISNVAPTTTITKEKEKEKEKEKKVGLAGKIAGIGVKAGRKVVDAAAAATATKVESTAATGSVRGGRVLRKRV